MEIINGTATLIQNTRIFLNNFNPVISFLSVIVIHKKTADNGKQNTTNVVIFVKLASVPIIKVIMMNFRSFFNVMIKNKQ